MRFLDMWKPLDKQITIIKTEHSDVEGLNEIIKQLSSLKDSEIYGVLYQVVRTKKNKLLVNETVDDLLKFSQYEYATKILKKPLLYFPPITDLIEAGHFLGIFSMIGFIIYTYKREYILPEDLERNFILLERLMSSLDDFDVVTVYDVPDEDFYRKLRQMKWDKEGKKLFGKLEDVRGKIMVDRGWGSASSTFQTGEMFMLGFLAACNAVNHKRSVMLPEDVIVAYKTYFKLLNTDISKLEL